MRYFTKTLICLLKVDYNGIGVPVDLLNISLLQREIINAQEAAMKIYEDSLITHGEKRQGDSNILIERANAAIKACKTHLHTDMERLLAIADPKNGEGFIKEVRGTVSKILFCLSFACHIKDVEVPPEA